jgi:hypothetical protein
MDVNRVVILLGLALMCLALAGCDGGDADGGGGSEASKGWTGRFDSSFGDLSFEAKGNKVTGNYDFCGGQLRGTADGNRLVGNWRENPDECEPGENRSPAAPVTGSFDFTLSSDGSSFTGTWRYSNGEKDPSGDTWEGTRVSG